MSKMHKYYVKLKGDNAKLYYLFKVGVFYVALDKDAKQLSKLLNLKLTKLNDEVMKCGFPINAENDYFSRLKKLKVHYEVIENIPSKKSVNKLLKEIDVEALNALEAHNMLFLLKRMVSDD